MSIFQSAQERYISKGQEYELYEKVALDMEKKELNKGIWAKALTDAEGDPVKQKAIYIKLMVDYYKDLIQAGEEFEAILANKKKKAEQVKKREIKKNTGDAFLDDSGFVMFFCIILFLCATALIGMLGVGSY